MTEVRACAVVPVYDHAHAIGAVVTGLRAHGLDVVLVDDGSHDACRDALRALAAADPDHVRLRRHDANRGKGAAMHTGWLAARKAGFTHALQVDADGQHDLADVPRLLALARATPSAVVTGIPVYDDSVPKSRLYGRYVTHVWVWIETLSLEIRDSMCGFRVYPLAATLSAWDSAPVARRMAFDTEILVRLWWRGTPLRQLPTRVTYPADGVSHFDLLWDNVRLCGAHTRLACGMLVRLPWLLARLVARHLPWRRRSAGQAA